MGQLHDNQTEKTKSWLKRLGEGLSRSANTVGEGVGNIFTKRKLDAQTLEELEELLIAADLGAQAAAEVAAEVGKGRYDNEISPSEVRGVMCEVLTHILVPVATPLTINSSCKPTVILVTGVNGSGKTTTIGKLAQQWRREGKKVMLAAGDTFRAAAIEQLKIWGERTGAPVIARAAGSDAAALAYEAFVEARRLRSDILLIDTAGRLQNRDDLMAELAKIIRVLRKLDPKAPHASLLVLDATTGQNALRQVEAFANIAKTSGLIMTKLDGTAKGGILVAIARRFALPIHAIGIGEGVDDLQPFRAEDFARALTGLPTGS
jgi:fused signal recognition particle receptor